MTVPTLTHGHGNLYDCDTTTGWAETEDGNTGATTSDGDIFDLNIAVSAGNKTYYWANTANLGLSSTTYPYAAFRYRTSDSSIKAEIVIEFNDATTLTILAETSSTTWAHGSSAITTGKTIDHVRLHADQATGNVYYDFALICKGAFSFPVITELSKATFKNNYPNISVPGRVGDPTQYLGSELVEIEFVGDMDTWGTWGSDPLYGQYLIDNWLNAHSEAWQWLTCDLGNMRMTIRELELGKQAGNKAQRVWRLLLKQYSLISGDDSDWANLGWIGL